MTSTFLGLEIAKRGLAAQQTALYVTGQNVSNASTPGYTRQVVNFQETDAYPAPGMNAPEMAGQLGTGVEAGSIQRVRDSYLDTQYRSENSQLGYWQASSDALNQMQTVMNEPSDTGLSNAMDQFESSLQALASTPTDPGALSVVRENGSALANTFNYIDSSLTSIQGNQQNQITTTVNQVNTDLQQLNTLNQEISKVESSGNLPNDLYDQRDNLLDDLSSMVNIKVSYNPPASSSANPTAEGAATVTMVNDDGTSIGTLLDGSNYYALNVNFDGASYNGTNSVGTMSIGSNPAINFSDTSSSGKLKALIESYGYDNNGTVTGTYPNMLQQLDSMAYTFASQFNAVQEAGQSQNSMDASSSTPPQFFSDSNDAAITAANEAGLAGRIQISSEIQNDANNIATMAPGAQLGDATNATNLANVVTNSYSYGSSLGSGGFQSIYQGVIGQLGVTAQNASNLTTNSSTLQQSADQQRQSVSSVSLDEEMTNMIQYQQAYSASAKMISMENSILDTIINGLGVGN